MAQWLLQVRSSHLQSHMTLYHMVTLCHVKSYKRFISSSTSPTYSKLSRIAPKKIFWSLVVLAINVNFCCKHFYQKHTIRTSFYDLNLLMSFSHNSLTTSIFMMMFSFGCSPEACDKPFYYCHQNWKYIKISPALWNILKYIIFFVFNQ